MADLTSNAVPDKDLPRDGEPKRLLTWYRPADASSSVAIGGILALLLPVLMFGPWLPLIDLVSFVGMDSYPPQQSYGPLHYYTFQFTYIGHAVLSRLFSDLQIPVRFHIVIFYLLQAGVCFAVVWRSLRRLIDNVYWRSIAIALGTLAFWDGVFLWGGPLAYSLAATGLSLATFLAMREAAEPERNASTAITLLVAFSLVCHPFAAPFALILCGVRFLFTIRRRWHTSILAAAILVFAYVIVKDSPPTEAGATGTLKLLFGFNLTQIGARITGLFQQDALFARILFGSTPVASAVLFFLLSVIHVAGFVISPYIALRARNGVWLRMLATLNSLVGLLYLFAWDLPTAPIPEWPQRILTLYAPFTYLGGIAGLLFVSRRVFPRSASLSATPPRLVWIVPAAILIFVAAVQVQVFGLGATLERNVAKTRAEILQSGVSNAYVVVAGIDSIRPFYLRCVPFLLFSDPELVRRNILVATEWHFQERHPSHLTETWFNLGRKRYLAAFSSADSVVSVRVIEQPADRFPVIEGTNLARWGTAPALAGNQFQQGLELFERGVYPAAWEHFNTALHLQPELADAWNDAGASLYRAGNKAGAVPFFRQAAQLAPNSAEMRMNLASALIDTGQLVEAKVQLEQVLRLQPDDARATELLKRITALTAGPAK